MKHPSHQEDQDSDDDGSTYDYEKCLGPIAQSNLGWPPSISADVVAGDGFVVLLLSGTMYFRRQMHCKCVSYLGVMI